MKKIETLRWSPDHMQLEGEDLKPVQIINEAWAEAVQRRVSLNYNLQDLTIEVLWSHYHSFCSNPLSSLYAL